MRFRTRYSSGEQTPSDVCGFDPLDAAPEEFASLVLAQAAVQGLEDLAEGRILTESELDDALLPAQRKGQHSAGAAGTRRLVSTEARKNLR